MTSRGTITGLVAAVLFAAACSDGDSGSPSTPTDTGGGPQVSVGRPDVPSVPSPSPAGSGVVVVGGSASSFEVRSCELEPDPAAPAGARALLAVTGAGTTGAGVPFSIELRRFATGTDLVTFTDTLTYTDSARILQAQRIEVGGQVTDLRDPSATSALVRPRAGGVSAAGLASAPGDAVGDEGLIGIALDATC